MKEELTQAELDAIFYGKQPKVEASFYKETILDVPASQAAGHRVEREQDYIHLRCVKEGSEFRRPAQAQDKRDFVREWIAYREEQKHELPGQVQDARDEPPSIGAALGKARQAAG